MELLLCLREYIAITLSWVSVFDLLGLVSRLSSVELHRAQLGSLLIFLYCDSLSWIFGSSSSFVFWILFQSHDIFSPPK